MGRYANLGEVRQTLPRRRWQHKHCLWFWNLSRGKKIFVILLPVLLFLILVPIGTYMYYARDIKDQERLMNRNNTGIVLTDANDKLFYSVGRAEHRNMVKLADISDNMKNALLASEDKDFYKHSGFNLLSIFRAAISRHGGGSTITQQLAKNTILSSERSFMRKYQEVFVALAIEQNYTKDQILEMYLNSIYYGEDSFGIEEAAKVYFGKTPKQLTLAESAMLVGLLPAPSAYSPISGDPKLAKERQTTVLSRMVKNGMITEQQKQTALAEQLAYASKPDAIDSVAPHFAQMVIGQLSEKFGSYEAVMRSGYQVKTTLSIDVQKVLTDSINKRISYINRYGGSNASGVVIDPKNGEIRALVGSVDYNNADWGKVNMATSPRQPGSSFKPIYYAAALADGNITPATIFNDKLTDFGGYVPYNASRTWYGNVSTRKALNWSLNIPSVMVMQRYGINKSVQAARNLGITTINDEVAQKNGLSLALGSGEARLTEMTNAYAAFANQGLRYDLGLIQQISDKYNHKVTWPNRQQHRAISEGGAYLISNILSDNTTRARIFGSTLNVRNHTVAVKTGTTNDNRDAWTIGYTPQYAVGVWVGNNNNEAMRMGGSDMAGSIWRLTMTELLSGLPNAQFTIPSNVVQRQVCASNGGLATSDNYGTYKEYFLSGALPTEQCNTKRTKIEVCNLSEKKLESIYEDDFDSKKYSKNTSDCKKTATKITVCDLTQKKIITIDEDAFDSTKHSRSTTNCVSRGNTNRGGSSDDGSSGDSDSDGGSESPNIGGGGGDNNTQPIAPNPGRQITPMVPGSNP